MRKAENPYTRPTVEKYFKCNKLGHRQMSVLKKDCVYCREDEEDKGIHYKGDDDEDKDYKADEG